MFNALLHWKIQRDDQYVLEFIIITNCEMHLQRLELF